jgi:hypothetical protein
MAHRWTESDDVVTLYLYRFGHKGLRCSPERIAELLGMSPDSLRMRVANFRAIDIGSGLDNAAQLTRQVFAEYGSLVEPALRNMAADILDEARRVI